MTEIKDRRRASYEAPEGDELGLLQAAFYLKMHPSYVRNLVVDGTIKGTKNEKGRWTVSKQALDTYLDERANASGRTPGEKASYGYVPAGVSSLRRVIKLVADAEIEEGLKGEMTEVLNEMLAEATLQWEAAKAKKAAEAESESESEDEDESEA